MFSHCGVLYVVLKWPRLNWIHERRQVCWPGLHLQNQPSHPSSVVRASRTVAIAARTQLHNCSEATNEALNSVICSHIILSLLISVFRGTAIIKQVCTIVCAFVSESKILLCVCMCVCVCVCVSWNLPGPWDGIWCCCSTLLSVMHWCWWEEGMWGHFYWCTNAPTRFRNHNFLDRRQNVWEKETEKQTERQTMLLCFVHLRLHIFHTCTCVSTECSIQWPRNDVISAGLTLGEQCVLHNKKVLSCRNNVSFTEEILSLWLHGFVPLVSQTSAMLLDHITFFLAQTEVVL